MLMIDENSSKSLLKVRERIKFCMLKYALGAHIESDYGNGLALDSRAMQRIKLIENIF